jgi:hypothetical protein
MGCMWYMWCTMVVQNAKSHYALQMATAMYLLLSFHQV